MKVALLCCVLLLAGTASCSPVEAKSISLPEIPDWILDLIDGLELPEAIQNIIDRLPEIIAAIPDIIDRIPEIIEQIVDKIPEVIPIILDKLPEIIAQIPALVERIREILEVIIDRIPEIIPIILEKIPEIIEALPAIAEKIREIYDKIREVLENLDLPDWFPTLPDLDKPEWWPDELPTLPDYNTPTPGVQSSVNDFPSIVQIEVGTRSVWAQGCTGSILTSVHILSAARCFSGRTFANQFRRIRAGSSTRFQDGVISAVDSARNHPDYNGNSLDADISIVRLANTLTFGSTIQQAAIVPQGFNVPTGMGVVLAGWGSTAQGKLISDRNLYAIDLVVGDKSVCTERWGKIPLFDITDNMLCIADPLYGGRNGDVRDLGAPVYLQGIVTSVVSVSTVGNQYFPVVTTSVGSYSDWIVSNAN